MTADTRGALSAIASTRGAVTFTDMTFQQTAEPRDTRSPGASHEARPNLTDSPPVPPDPCRADGQPPSGDPTAELPALPTTGAEIDADGEHTGTAGPAAAPAASASAQVNLSRQERRLRFWMKLWAASFVIEIGLYMWWALAGLGEARGFAVNSVAKDFTFLVLAVLVIADVRRFGRLMTLLVVGHLAIAVVLMLLLVTGTDVVGFPGTPAALAGQGPSSFDASWAAAGWLALALFAAAHMGWLHVTARRGRYGLRCLYPALYDTLVALTQTVLPDATVGPRQVATAVDRYWDGFNGNGRPRVIAALVVLYILPVLTLRSPVPFPMMDDERRRDFIGRHFVQRTARLRCLTPIRAAIRFAVQMAYMGYYSQPETHAEIGYTPFSQRPSDEPPPAKRASGLTVLSNPPNGELTADVVIVGTGAGAGIVAHCLVERGHDVLMLERGKFVEPAAFTEDELEMYSTLYSDGAVQIARDFAFQVLQGRCVGGSTVVNNAVCFDLPPAVLERWNGAGAGLSPQRLAQSFAQVRTLMTVAAQPASAMSAGVTRFQDAVTELGLDAAPYHSDVVDANIDHCLGCGYCNIGCAYGRKLSMLDHLLPRIQRYADNRLATEPGWNGRLRILPDCEVTRIEASNGTARAAECLLGSERRPLRVSARKTVVVAAGAIQSSRLLQCSEVGGTAVGAGLCANIATFMTGVFEDPIDASEGIQIARYVEPPQRSGYVLETWFNPPVITALSMPGWLEDHRRNMLDYSRTMCVGVLVGTDPRAHNRVGKRSRISGSEYALRPSDEEIARVAEALEQAGRILFKAGATRVMPATFEYREYRSPDELDDLADVLRRTANRSLQSAHPQGGNPIGRDSRQGVVDSTCRVHGYDNLYVCDASVFPTAVTVNPQMTVMALAHYAATHPDGLGRPAV